MDDAAENVAGEVVGAQKMPLGQGREEAFGPQVTAQKRIVGGDEIGAECDENEKDDDPETDHGQPVGAERKPGAEGLAEPRLAARGGLVGEEPVTAGHRGHACFRTRGSRRV